MSVQYALLLLGGQCAWDVNTFFASLVQYICKIRDKDFALFVGVRLSWRLTLVSSPLLCFFGYQLTGIDNIDPELEKYLEKYFPKEYHEKRIAVETERGKEQFGEGYRHPSEFKCFVMWSFKVGDMWRTSVLWYLAWTCCGLWNWCEWYPKIDFTWKGTIQRAYNVKDFATTDSKCEY